MAEFNNAVITNKGRELASKLLAGDRMEFTKVVTSDHKYPVGTDLASVVNIPSIRQTSPINNVTIQNQYSVNVVANFKNTNIVVGYNIRVVGLYAKDLDDNEILYSISTTNKPDYMPPFNGVTLSTVEYSLITSVSNADNVIINLYDGNTISREEFKDHLESEMPHEMLIEGVKHRYGFEQENGFLKFKTEEVI